MARQHHYRRRTKEPADLDMTTFLNLMVVLVPFLLITAVFSRITIVELSLPGPSNGKASNEQQVGIEVIVRDAGLELTNGTSVIAALPKVEGNYDLEQLSEMMQALKRQFPEKQDASVLLEPQIEYDQLIKVMDTVRSADIPAADEPQGMARVALFTDISIGDAP